jgi:hypothetical protein
VIGAQDDGVALEERLDPARGGHQGGDRVVGACHGRRTQGVTTAMSGGIRLWQVEEQEVEAVSCDEPSPYGRCVRVILAADAEAGRRAGALGGEELAEVELARAVGGVHEARAAREACEHRVLERVPHATAPDGEVDRGRDHAGVLDRLEDRGQLGREVDVVEVHDGVVHRLLGALGERRLERRPVLHEALLAAVVPLQRGNARAIGAGPGRDRREAHRRQRGEGRDGLAEVPSLEQHAEVRSRATRDGRGERVRREAVDDDQDELLPRHGAAA